MSAGEAIGLGFIAFGIMLALASIFHAIIDR